MEHDLNELVTLQQEIDVLEREVSEYINLIKNTEDNAELIKLGKIVTSLWDKLDNIREYKYSIESRIHVAIYQQ